MELEEFTRRFTAEAKRLAGFDTFDDGQSVEEYCTAVVSASRSMTSRCAKACGPKRGLTA